MGSETTEQSAMWRAVKAIDDALGRARRWYNDSTLWRYDGLDESIDDAFMEAYELARRKPSEETITWYPVSVEPPKAEKYLVRLSGDNPWRRITTSGWYRGAWGSDLGAHSARVTHWAHMPKGPGQ